MTFAEELDGIEAKAGALTDPPAHLRWRLAVLAVRVLIRIAGDVGFVVSRERDKTLLTEAESSFYYPPYDEDGAADG